MRSLPPHASAASSLPAMPCFRPSGKRSHWARSVQVWKRKPQSAIYFGRCWLAELFLVMNSSMLCCISLAVKRNTQANSGRRRGWALRCSEPSIQALLLIFRHRSAFGAFNGIFSPKSSFILCKGIMETLWVYELINQSRASFALCAAVYRSRNISIWVLVQKRTIGREEQTRHRAQQLGTGNGGWRLPLDFSKRNPVQMERSVKDNSSERASSNLMSRF